MPGATGVGRRRGGGVTGGGADDGRRLALERLGNGHRHAAVLEGTGRVETLELEPDPRTDALGQARRLDQRRAALEHGYNGGLLGDGKEAPVLLDDASPTRSGSGLLHRCRSHASKVAHALPAARVLGRSQALSERVAP